MNKKMCNGSAVAERHILDVTADSKVQIKPLVALDDHHGVTVPRLSITDKHIYTPTKHGLLSISSNS